MEYLPYSSRITELEDYLSWQASAMLCALLAAQTVIR